MKERLNSLRHFEKIKGFNSLSQNEKKDFNSLSHIEKRFNSMSQVIFLENKFNSESVIQKKFNTLSHIREKSGILWVVLENFNSLSRIQKKVQCRIKKSFSKKKKTSSILWVVCFLQKQSSVSRIRTWKNFILRVTMKKRINSASHFFGKKNILKRRFKSVSHKKSNSLSFVEKKGFNSSSHIEKNLWVILKKSSVLWIVFLRQAQFFECFFSKKNFNSLSHTPKNSILWVMLQKFQFSEWFFVKKKVQFFESC